MTDQSNLRPPDQYLDGRIFLAAAMVAAWIGLVLAPGWAGYGVALVAVCAVGLTIVRGYADLLALPKAFGTMGWVMLALALWVASSMVWSSRPESSGAIVLAICIAVVFGLPAILIAFRLTPDSAAVVPTFYGVFAIVAILVFEAASGGALRTVLHIDGGQFGILYVLLSICLWPVSALLYRVYGWKEAVLWLLVCLVVIAIAAGPVAKIISMVGLFCFLMCFASVVLTRFVLLLGLLFCSFGPAVAVTLYGDRMNAWVVENGTQFPFLTNKVDAWRLGLTSWSESPLLGWGAGIVAADGSTSFTTASVQTNAFLELMLGTGVVGLMLAILSLCFLILRVVQGASDGWRLPAAAAVLGSGLAVAVSGLGFWQAWIMGAFVLSGIAIAGCRPVAAKSAALGSIFESAKDDPDLYHFDNDLYDDDDDDYDDDEDDEDSEEGDLDDGDASSSRRTPNLKGASDSRTNISEEGEWHIDDDPLDSDKRR
ncbi:MAG: hypothetical protein P1V34_05950 [Alphaproteobacteria bacterium]|nr:hypothetical protein [Alphaproteobacteria bacterium]